MLLLGQESQGLKTARAGSVKFKVESRVVEGGEQSFGYGFIGAAAVVSRVRRVACRMLLVL